jgi:hypothetical protein
LARLISEAVELGELRTIRAGELTTISGRFWLLVTVVFGFVVLLLLFVVFVLVFTGVGVVLVFLFVGRLVLVEAVSTFFEEDFVSFFVSFFVSLVVFDFVFLSVFEATIFDFEFVFFFGVGVGFTFAVVFWFDLAFFFGVGVALAAARFGVGVAFFDLFGVDVDFPFLTCALETVPIKPSATNAQTTIKIPIF